LKAKPGEAWKQACLQHTRNATPQKEYTDFAAVQRAVDDRKLQLKCSTGDKRRMMGHTVVIGRSTTALGNAII